MWSSDFHLGSQQHQMVVVALIAVAISCAVVLIFQKFRRNAKKRRHLLAKINAFHQAERRRRDEIRARPVDTSEQPGIMSLPFTELVQKLQNGDLKATDVLHTYQRAVLASTEKTNAATEFILQRAEQQAAKLDELPPNERKPLHGVPISVKECYFVPGTDATLGFSQFLGCYQSENLTPLVQFLEWLGCVSFVKTNIPQGVLSFDSRNPIYGMARNPHNLSRSPGGSSSGEGALIGGKVSILGVGSDVGGSLRIPAAWCGCYSLKPTSSRMLQGGSILSDYCARAIIGDLPSMGLMTQDVDTLVAVHRLLYSPETFQQFRMSSLAPISFRKELFDSNGPKLTIGYCDCDGVMETVPAMKRAIKIAKEALEKQGHRLVEWNITKLIREAILMYFRVMSVDGATETMEAGDGDIEVSYPNKIAFIAMKLPYWLKKLLAFLSQRFVGDFPADVMRNLRPGKQPNDVNIEFRKLLHFRKEFAKAFQAASLDALLWPSFPCPAAPLDAPRDMLAAVSYTALFNLLDWPAGIYPITKVVLDDETLMSTYPGERDMYHRAIKKANSEGTVGLPVSVQIAAPQFCEETVLRLMSDMSAASKI